MQLQSTEIQAKIDHLNQLIQQGAADAQLNLWEMQRKDLQDQLAADELNKQAHEGRVQEATTEITERIDSLYLGGQTLRELSADEEGYQIIRISFMQDYISQATKNSEVLSKVQAEAQTEIKQANDRANLLDEQNSNLLLENHRLTIELKDVTERFNAVELLLSEAPSSEETDRLNQEIKDLKAKLEIKARAEEPVGDAKSQIDAMVQERENKKVKITNLRLADPSGINTKDYLATDVLTGEEIKIHSNYVKSYKEVSAEEAEQIRTAIKALADSIPETKEPDVLPVNPVTETDEAAAIQPFPESNQVDANTNGENPEAAGNRHTDEVVGEAEESQVVTRAEFNELKGRVDILFNNQDIGQKEAA